MTGAEPDQRATSVVIVNHRTKELTHRAALSVLDEHEVRELLVVDNASEDGSAEFLRQALSGAPVRVIESPLNVGFGGAANLAAQQAMWPLLFLLNSDATLKPGSLGPLADRLLESESNAVVAPAIHHIGDGESQRGSFGTFPTLWDGPWARSRRGGGSRPADDRLSPDWVSGVAMLLRRRDFLAIGGFDPDFHMYLEDVDLCRRFRERGMAVRREPASVVTHVGGASWQSAVDQRERYQASKVTYFRKAGASPAQLAYLRAVKGARVLVAKCSPARLARAR